MSKVHAKKRERFTFLSLIIVVEFVEDSQAQEQKAITLFSIKMRVSTTLFYFISKYV